MQSLTAQLSNRFSSALVLFLSVFVTTQALALSPEEKVRTESLLAELGKQQNLTFTRNGTEHSAADAESHLRLKLRKTEKRLKTTEQFIDNVASKSSITGEEYQVKDAQGNVIPANKYLHGLLKDKVDNKSE
ncbi:DUF5329 family protein [Providencia hangzhouensis]|mgnify:CR=1 FL=1|uniref:DUF5329 domain-containing protein n=2 Tax=Providencia TaxID=586 RepID=A0A2A5Q156_PRORE|nr:MULTISPECIES: DUF5329 family protein [Providencia]EFE54743.1 hypothetical protein PROVRETT_06561 [Providencia rettgeri DSM 1131]EHZ6873620.1 DUF5329 domain-containing protein [Providencia rettgeri]MBG5894428.1 DUF5329 domain-containing protein [Providencia rettgeri]MBG5929060.1 DUF5329 domain-containing protein [Providencia rettgeri]MBN6366717.1 DUF5329 domain-containing protein [Providencia rettgeri]